MLELDGKKLAYQQSNLQQLESKREAAYFLNSQMSLPWIQRAALEGIQAGFIAMLIQWKSVLTKRQTVSLSAEFLDQFGISRGVKLRSLKLLEKEGSNLYENLTKKETQMLNRERVKLSDQHRGIKDMRKPPDAVVIVDGQYEATAIKEATSMNIPIVALVDSNTDPSIVDFPIPANDDSLRTIQLIIGNIADSILEIKGTNKDKNSSSNTDSQNSSVNEETVISNDEEE